MAQFNCTVNIVCFQLTLNHVLFLIPKEIILHLNDFFFIILFLYDLYDWVIPLLFILKYSLMSFMAKRSNHWGANTVFIQRHKKQWKVFLVVFLPCLFRNLSFELHLSFYLLWFHEQNLFPSWQQCCVIMYRHMNFLYWCAWEFIRNKKNQI